MYSTTSKPWAFSHSKRPAAEFPTLSSSDANTSAKAKVVIKKATPKIIASKKTFNMKVKTKKYTITLKNNLGKVMKNTKVTLKIKSKTYTAKTNKKGQATFTVKLTKKGNYKATVKYGGSNLYNKVSKNVSIVVKK